MLKPPSCLGCPLTQFDSGFSTPDGDGTSGVALIGDSLDYEGRIDGKPFRPRSQSGSKLQEIFRLAQEQTGRPISRSQFLLWNIIACRPPTNELVGSPYEARAIEHCTTHFNQVMNGFHTPHNKVLLAMGGIPMQVLTGVSGNAKEKQSIHHLRGFVFPSKYGWVIPTFRPGFLKKGNSHLTPLVVGDLIRAMDVAQGRFTDFAANSIYQPPKYQVTPGIDEAWSFYYKAKDNVKLPLAFDIETPNTKDVEEDDRDELIDSDINLVQFSLSRRSGIAFPFEGEYISVIKALFALGNPKANHNCYNFDNPRLYAKGITINGVIHDTMWMFKHWHSKLPRGLQSVASMLGFPFPWKHLFGTNLNWYGCADVDAVQWILHKLPGLMKAKGVWDGYRNHIVRLHPILERGRNHGIPVNEVKRIEVEKLLVETKKKLNKELQKEIPDELRNIAPKRKDKATGIISYGYVREPKLVSRGVEEYAKTVSRFRANRVSTDATPCSVGEFLYRKYGLVYREVIGPRTGSDKSEKQSDVAPSIGGIEGVDRTNAKQYEGKITGGIDDTSTPAPINRWFKIAPFKGSKEQLTRYLRWKQKQIDISIDTLISDRQSTGGRNPELTKEINRLKELRESYEIPRNIRTKKETTSKHELEELYHKNADPVIERVMAIRSLDTNLNNYLPNWKPASDGRVHTTFGFTAPTGQLDSRRPNILNCSKHTKIGQIFRGIIEAPEGYVFLECDKKSFHVGTMGYCANSKRYIKFSQTDPHSILGSYISPDIIGGSIDLKWSAADIILAAEEFKTRCKQAREKDPVYGIDVRQQLAKPTVLGNQLGLGARKLQRQNRRFIKTLADAERLQGILQNLFPEVEEFKRRIKEQAFTQRYLINEFGFIQWFFDIFQFSFNKRSQCWDRKEGDGAREPIAFRVQGTAFGMIQEETIKLEDMGVCAEHKWINSIHDSLMFMPEKSKIDKAVEVITGVMNSPCKKLANESTGPEGLIVKVDISIGRNWQNYDEKENPEGMREVKY